LKRSCPFHFSKIGIWRTRALDAERLADELQKENARLKRQAGSTYNVERARSLLIEAERLLTPEERPRRRGD
jgi:hypothetical protein